PPSRPADADRRAERRRLQLRGPQAAGRRLFGEAGAVRPDRFRRDGARLRPARAVGHRPRRAAAAVRRAHEEQRCGNVGRADFRRGPVDVVPPRVATTLNMIKEKFVTSTVNRFRAKGTLAACALLLTATHVLADDYPSRPLRVVVPYAAGGP